jgi:soluble lytic murein transglycosylase-like protein
MPYALRSSFCLILILCGFTAFPGNAFANTPKAERAMQRYSAIISNHALANDIPVDLALAVVNHESSFDANATGQAGEIGLMQIKLSTARGMGYEGSAEELYEPATNIRWGMKYLGKARELARGSECGTLSRYNGGHGTKHMIRGYCQKVRLAMRG